MLPSVTNTITPNVPQSIIQQQQHNPVSSQPILNILHNQSNQNHNSSENEMMTSVHRSLSPQSPISNQSPIPSNNTCSPVPSSTANGLISKIPDGMSSLKSIAQQVIIRAGLEIPPPSEPTRNIFDSNKSNNNNNSTITSEAHIPPLLGVAPLGPVPLQKEHQHQFQMMEAAYYHMPHPSDSERLRSYLPRNLCQTPQWYQQVS